MVFWGSVFLSQKKSFAMSETLYRIAVVGGGGVGKSCLTIRFLRDMFVEKYDPTIEESYRKQVTVDGRAITLEILDTAGQEEYTAIRDRYLRKQDAFCCIFSLTSKATVGEIKRTFLHIRRVKDSDAIVGVLVANKCDVPVEERAVSSEVGMELGREFNIPYIECSAKTGEKVSDSFMMCVQEAIRTRSENPEYGKGPAKDKKKRRKRKKGGGCTSF